MDNIEENCLQLFLKNLTYLQNNFPELHSKLNLFNMAIEQNIYKEKYSLEYKDNNYFDIYDHQTKKFLYGTDSNQDTITRTKNITFDDKNSFGLTKKVKVPKKYEIDPNICNTVLTHIYPLLSYIDKNIDEDNGNKIEKFICIGSALGLHIEPIIKKTRARTIIIIEPNIEIFRLSLFTTDYEQISLSTELHLSVAEDNNEFDKTFNKFYTSFSIFNYGLKFDLFFDNYHHILDEIGNILVGKDSHIFPFSAMLMSLEREASLLDKKYNILSLRHNEDIFEDKPVLILAAGPSLEKNIKWLEKNHSKFITVALGASLKKLAIHDIVPDIITSVDPNLMIDQQFEVDEKYYKDSIFICSNNTHPDILKIFEQNNTFVYQVIFNLLTKNGEMFGSKSVGEVTFALMLINHVKELYLLGTDMAFDQSTGAAHIKEHLHYKKNAILKKHNIIENTNIELTDTIEVDGNLQEKVFTDRKFLQLINYYNKFSNHLLDKEKQTIYNLSDGAKLENTIPIDINKLAISHLADIEKLQTTLTLKDNFSTISSRSLSDNEIFNIKSDMNTIEILLKEIKKYKKNRYKDYKKMMYDKLTVMIDVVDTSKALHYGFLYQIFVSYTENTDAHINNFFRSPKNQNSKQDINNIFQFWIKPIDTILVKYVEILNKLIK